MDEEKKPTQEPQILVTCTREEAAALLAALTHYLMYVKRNPELQEVIPILESLQRKLVEQARGRAPVCNSSI